MYTGIVEETAEITSVRQSGEGKELTIHSTWGAQELSRGDSISVSGVCLTAEELTDSEFRCFAAEETLERSWLSGAKEGDLVNLELPLKPEDRMGGHIVEGHVEATATILDIESLEEGWNFTVQRPESIDQYIVEKGYVGFEGMSLTVTETTRETFSVTIIPETWERSNLDAKDEGDEVNVETDIVARYIEEITATNS